MIHILAIGDRVQPAAPWLEPFTGTVVDVSSYGHIVTVDIDNGHGLHSFDVDDLKEET